MSLPTLVVDTMTQEIPSMALMPVPEKPFISPPHSPLPLCDSPTSGSPHQSPSLSRSTSEMSISGAKRTPSLTFTSPQARKRGYVRPQGTEFSKSARSRESVMALGSIAHVQHFFAKTGLLDGKGGGYKKKKSDSGEFDASEELHIDSQLIDSTYSSLRSSPELILPDEHYAHSPIGDNDDIDDDPNAILPPTYSTYKPRTPVLPPPPDRETLREELKEALDDCRRAWVDAASMGFAPKDKASITSAPSNGLGISSNEPVVHDDEGISQDKDDLPVPGLKDILLHTILRSTTLAIRAAKEYYYAADMAQLMKITTEKRMREDFLGVLDVLKKISVRQGGIMGEEKSVIISWIDGVEGLLSKEDRMEDEGRRKGQVWVEGNWTGREWERFHRFLSYFDAYAGTAEDTPLPEHTPENPAESPLLKVLQTGRRLIMLHNAVVRRSRRPFGQIPHFHTDFNKPYRLAENLRYWLKAAEIRWEVKISMDVMGVATGTPEGMKSLEKAVYVWCEKVLAEVVDEWKEDQVMLSVSPAERKERRRSRRYGSPSASPATSTSSMSLA